MNGYVPFVIVGVFIIVLVGAIVQKVRSDKRANPVLQRVLADPAVKTFPKVHVQLNPETNDEGFLKGGSDLIVRGQSFDFGLSTFRGAFRYYFIAQDTEMRAAELRFGNIRNRQCILIRGERAGKPMEAALSAEGQLAEMWMYLASAGVKPMSEVPSELL